MWYRNIVRKGRGGATTFLVENDADDQEDCEVVLTVLWVDDGAEVVPTDVEMPTGVLEKFATVVEALVVQWACGTALGGGYN